MIVTPGVQRYEVVLQDKYFLRECIQKLSLEDRLDEISYSAKVTLAAPGDQFDGLPEIKPGMEIRISGTKFGDTSMSYIIHPGVVWDIEIANRARRNWNLTIYDRAIYLAKSKDEYLWKEGETASDRISRICSDWGIPIKNIPDTGKGLAAATVRAKPLWGIMHDALKETAGKTGQLYTVRMQPDGLEVFEIGTNEDVWVFEFGANLESITQKQSLSGAVTKVKILGKASKDERSPVVSEVTGEVEKLGTIQEILSDQKAIDNGTATSKAEGMIAGVQETVKVQAIDINTIRKGDKVIVDGYEDGLYVMSVRHELGTPGKMQMELATKEYIRRKYYHER